MKINSMTTISKSITLKVLRATNQICQLKSNSGCIYKQTAVVSVTQHEGLMGLSLLLTVAVMGWHGSYSRQMTESKLLLWFHT